MRRTAESADCIWCQEFECAFWQPWPWIERNGERPEGVEVEKWRQIRWWKDKILACMVWHVRTAEQSPTSRAWRMILREPNIRRSWFFSLSTRYMCARFIDIFIGRSNGGFCILFSWAFSVSLHRHQPYFPSYVLLVVCLFRLCFFCRWPKHTNTPFAFATEPFLVTAAWRRWFGRRKGCKSSRLFPCPIVVVVAVIRHKCLLLSFRHPSCCEFTLAARIAQRIYPKHSFMVLPSGAPFLLLHESKARGHLRFRSGSWQRFEYVSLENTESQHYVMC